MNAKQYRLQRDEARAEVVRLKAFIADLQQEIEHGMGHAYLSAKILDFFTGPRNNAA